MQTKEEKILNISIEVYTNVNGERVFLYATDSLNDLNTNIEELIKIRLIQDKKTSEFIKKDN